MTKFRFSPALLVVLLLIIFFGVSLFFRIYQPYNQIFVDDQIKYTHNDAYYYMRLVDNAATNFPHLTQFDPYYIYPGGNNVTSLPFYHWMIVFISWVAGAGHPTQHLIDLVGVFLPAILGALTLVPVFFIGKALFNKWAGLFAAGLVAILPGEYLSRSMLGSSDNPVAEVFFTATAMAFLIYAIKTASQNQLTFSSIFKREWKVILKPLILSVFAGLFLGFYLATWQGALLFVAIISLYLVIQFIINHIKQKSSDYLCIVAGITFLLGLIILVLNPFSTDVTIAMVLAFFLPLVIYGISRLMSAGKLSTVYYPITLIGLAVLAVVVVRFVAPETYNVLLAKLQFVFFPTGSTASTTLEMAPVLMPDNVTFTAYTAWANFTTSIFTNPWWLIPSLVGAAICGYLFYTGNKARNDTPVFVFFFITTVVILGWTLQQFLIPNVQNRYLSDSVLFIPGLALISLSILLYLFVRRDKSQPWYIVAGWIILILGSLSLLMVFTTYVNLRFLVALPLLIIFYILFRQREGDEHLRLFIIWSLVILIILLIQRRFQYYFAVNVAVLSGYLCWEIVRLSGLNKLSKKPEDAAKKVLDFTETAQKRDYYELLGISRNASYKEIKSSYRKLMSTYHPGPDNPPEIVEKIKELNKAYQILTNPSQRAEYESTRREVDKKKWHGQSQKGKHGRGLYFVNVGLSIIVVFFFVFCPNIARAQDQSSAAPFAISNDWETTLLWMRDNTPDPMGDANAYYKDYDAIPEGETFVYPDSAYGVMAWWDFGYWISRVAHRLPNTNPSQSYEPIFKVANFFLSQDLTSAEETRQLLHSRYIISDYEVSTSKLAAIIQWAGLNVEKYLPEYFIAQGSQLYQAPVYSLDYYRTLIVRLYNFDGKAVAEGKPTVITYEMATTTSGVQVKLITDSKDFNSYQEAVDYIASQDSTKSYEIVGSDPLVSPIALEALDNYTEIYTSAISTNATHPVKIFEYTGDN